MTERSSGTRYSRKNSGGTPPSKPYPLSQRPADRGSKASKCRPTKQIPPPTSATRRQRKRSFQMSSDKANSPSHVSDPQTEEAKLPNVVRQSKFPLPRQRPADRGSEASKCRPTKQIPPSSVSNSQTEEAKLPNVVRPTLPEKKFTLSIPKERRTSNDNNKIQRQTHPNPYINPNHHLPHHPQLQPDPCSSRTQRGHNPERLLPHHNPVTR